MDKVIGVTIEKLASGGYEMTPFDANGEGYSFPVRTMVGVKAVLKSLRKEHGTLKIDRVG
jgi:hypothetical protein